MHDLVIRGGTLIDGTGSAPVIGDLAIDEGRIVSVGDSVGEGRRESQQILPLFSSLWLASVQPAASRASQLGYPSSYSKRLPKFAGMFR